MDIAKLPKWAQDHIRKLESELAGVREALANRNGEFAGGRVLINPHNDLRLEFPDHTEVRFVIADDWRSYFEVRLQDKGITIHSGGPMLIEPRVTNVIELRLVD